MEGWYRDVVSSRGRVRARFPWRSNRIVSSAYVLHAILLRGEEGMGGLRYLAVGTGDDGWDARLPAPTAHDTQLTQELHRSALGPAQVAYADAQGGVSPVPTSRLAVSVTLDAAVLSQGGETVSLREFGLFGGDASAVANSGSMINRVIHPRIELAASDTLTRTVLLSLVSDTPAPPAEAGGDFAVGLPVARLQGIGEIYDELLRGVGVTTLGDLAALSLTTAVEGISSARLQEFCAKARAVAQVRIEAGAFEVFAHWPADALLSAPLASLVSALELAPGDASGRSAAQRAIDLLDALIPVRFGVDEHVLELLTLRQLRAGDASAIVDES